MTQQRRQIRLNDEAEADAELIRAHFNLSSRSEAIRYALREVARGIRYDIRYGGQGERTEGTEGQGKAGL